MSSMITKAPSSSNALWFKLWPSDLHGVCNWILIFSFSIKAITVEPGFLI